VVRASRILLTAKVRAHAQFFYATYRFQFCLRALGGTYAPLEISRFSTLIAALYALHNCAPYGYYGPEWFTGGVFIGAGPWFHGNVDNRFDPHHGNAGPFPERGDKAFNHFRGNEMRDGRGHAGGGGHR
jgi:hypothetical protein